MPGYSKPLVLAAVIGSAPTVAGMGALLSSATCTTVELSRSFGISLSQALAAAGITSSLFPAGCNLDSAFDNFCSDAGLACASEFTVPTLGAIDADSITAYQRSIAQYADCWADGGALRPLAACTYPSVFESMQQTITAAESSINSSITQVQSQIDAARAAGQSTVTLEAQLNGLQSAAEAAQYANEVTRCSSSGTLCSRPPAPPATDEGPNEAETGVIVVGGAIVLTGLAGAAAVYRAGM